MSGLTEGETQVVVEEEEPVGALLLLPSVDALMDDAVDPSS